MLFSLFLVSSLFFLGSSCVDTGRSPHIIFIIADDLGYNDVGFSYAGNSGIPTPNLDQLASEGVILDRQYTQPLCSPTRSTLMTGRYPIRTGMQRGVVLPPAPWGVPLDEVFIPQLLNEDHGYSTHLVGKWHLGYYQPGYTAVQRGFQTHYGSYFSTNHVDHLKDSTFVGKNWARDTTDGFSNDDGRGFSTSDLTIEAVDILDAHDPEIPIYLHMAYLAPHNPLEIDEDHKDPACTDETVFPSSDRRVLCTMVNGVDDSVGQIVAKLKDKGMYDNSVIVFISDNGGLASQSSNYPLRGQKISLLEGGVRVPAFVVAPNRIKNTGVRLSGPIHSVDWFTTLLALASGKELSQTTYKDSGNISDLILGERYQKTFLSRTVDGVNVWPYIAQEIPLSPREDVLINIDNDSFQVVLGNHASIIVKHKYKYFKGDPGFSVALNCNWGDGHSEPLGTFDQFCTFPLNGDQEALIDLEADVGETTNVIDQYPEIAQYARERVAHFQTEYVDSIFSFTADPESNPDLHDGWWNVWDFEG